MKLKNPILVFGAGGAAKDMLLSFPEREFVFFDNVNPIGDLYGWPVINSFDRLPSSFYFVISVAEDREKWCDTLTVKGGTMIRLISEDSRVLGSVQEAVIESNSMVSPSAVISRGAFINKSVVVTHDCRVGEFSVLSPAVTLGGHTKIGNNVFMGIGAITLPKVVISDNVIVGAGAVVTKNIDSGTYVGVPAKKVNHD